MMPVLLWFVVRELSSSFTRLCHYVDLTKNDLQQELNDLGTVISHLDDAAMHAKSLKYASFCTFFLICSYVGSLI